MKKIITITLSIFALALVLIPRGEVLASPACPLTAEAGETIVTFNDMLLFSSAPPHFWDKTASVPAGEYSVTAVTYDDHSGHGGQSQGAEVVLFVFRDSSANEIARTGNTIDIPEGADFQTTSLGNINLTRDVGIISPYHGAIGTGNYQSVYPICLKFKPKSTPAPTLNASCSVTPSSVQTGQNVTWDANATGGTGSYTYSWSGADTDGKTSENFSKNYSSTGTKTATVTVTSGNQTKTATCSVNVTSIPTPDLNVSCSASPSSVQTGQNITWDANATGGTGSYTYSWSTGQTSENFSTSYSSNGTKSQTVTVTSGGNTASASCSVNVTDTPTNPSDPAVSCSVSDSSINKGDTVRFSANASSGTSPYNYDWDLDIDGDDQYEDVRFNSTGSYKARITITDKNGKTAQATCPTVVVKDEDDDDDDDDLEISCRVSDTRIEKGDTVTYEVRIRDGNSPYDIDWRGDISGDDEKERVRYNRTGTYEVSVRVEDEDGDRDTVDCPDVKVSDDDDDDRDNDINVITSTNFNRPTGNLASLDSVFLSQIPYTGPADVAKVLGILAVVAVWSTIIAMQFKKKRALKTVSNKIADFKEKNKLASTIK